MDGQEAISQDSAVQWLEEDLRQTKSQLAKLQQQVEQLQGHLWRAAEETQRTQEVLTALRIQVEGLAVLQEQVRQLANELPQLKEEEAALRAALDGAERQWQLAVERERQERAQALRRLETMEKLLSGAEQRFASLEEGQHLLRLDLAVFQKSLGQLEHSLGEVVGRADRNLEASKRLEQGLERVDRDLDALHKQDDVLLERFQLYSEQMRRLEERLSALAAEQASLDDILNRLEMVRVEGQHLGERLSALERALDGQQQMGDDRARALDLLGAKLQGQAERLMELQRQLGAYHQELLAHLHRWSQLQEKQRRRQLSHLEQELRELKQYDLNLNTE